MYASINLFKTVEKILRADIENFKEVFGDLAILLIKFAHNVYEDVGLMALKDLYSLINKFALLKDKPQEDATITPTPQTADSKLICGITESMILPFKMFLIS